MATLFDGPGPRLFALPPGVDFPRALVDGLRDRLSGQPPEAMARVTVFVNTDRMARRLRTVFDAGEAALLPQIRLVTDLADPLTRARLPAPVPPLRRRLELTTLVARLLEAEPDLAPRAALYDLSDSLAALMEEMQTEGVDPDTVAALDVTDQSGHWQRALRFLQIVQRYFGDEDAPDRARFARLALEARLAAWDAAPPADPVIVAGSTGSRGTTHQLMRAVARLPQGAVVLPGFDFDQPPAVWDRLDDPLRGEDHPQFRFARLLRELDMAPDAVLRWTAEDAPAPARNRVLSLALRPAPVTHQWLTEGPGLPDLPQAMAGVTLLEAPGPRAEARTIALRLRQAAEDGTRAALITPDRVLTRQVTAALDRWGIVPDDSAGMPAQLTPPGRFLRQVAALFARPLTADALLALLKHPLTHSGAGRGDHLLHTRELELHIRRKGWARPDPDAVRAWGAARDCPDWAAWVADAFTLHDPGPRPLAARVAAHLDAARAVAAGARSDDSSALWAENAGRELDRITTELAAEADVAADLDARDYADLFGAIVAGEEVRDRDAAHPDILIWGTLEARGMGADLLILAGLNEGSWPEMPAADPWLNRAMRAEAGLLLPDRRIGLSTHDFQIAAGGPEVWLSRAVKSDEAETVPSRWVNRLSNLLAGLPTRHGPEALQAMRDRGRHWLALADAAEVPLRSAPAPRPAPRPPIAARPRQLSVTEIRTLIRDPYAIYARHVLGLQPLDPLMRPPDALMRGIFVHDVLERAVREARDTGTPLTAEGLCALAADVIGDPAALPFPVPRILWRRRIEAVADWVARTEATRRALAHPAHLEVTGAATIPALGFTLTAKADRIDVDPRGGAHLYDYKTGDAPSAKAQLHFDKQLLLEAAMVDRRAFKDLAPGHVAAATYLSLKPSGPKAVAAPLDEAPPGTVWEEFTELVAAYLDENRGFTARRALLKDAEAGRYDHLARFGEWDVTDPADDGVLE